MHHFTRCKGTNVYVFQSLSYASATKINLTSILQLIAILGTCVQRIIFFSEKHIVVTRYFKSSYSTKYNSIQQITDVHFFKRIDMLVHL